MMVMQVMERCSAATGFDQAVLFVHCLRPPIFPLPESSSPMLSSSPISVTREMTLNTKPTLQLSEGDPLFKIIIPIIRLYFRRLQCKS